MQLYILAQRDRCRGGFISGFMAERGAPQTVRTLPTLRSPRIAASLLHS